ncbi:MAG: immunoglobulin-like domain-containing protein [Oscillospiraceae bacterium]|nr:immunoglobulin-like domain-containing protein [Oscillospiraceae bacterium]
MKKRLSALLLALVLVISLLPTGALATGEPWDGRAKTMPADVEGVYQIGTAAELAWFAQHVNETAACADSAVLTADIDLNGKAWTPIGTKTSVAEQYSGNFDGNYHMISGLSITKATANQGLFGLVNGSTVQKLKVEGIISCGTSNYIGGIVGKMQAGSIINCSFSGSVTGGYAGGIAGYAGNTSNPAVEIQGCANSGAVQGTYAGGIVSYAKYSTISNCYNTGAITGTSRAGGIAGQLQNNCTAQYCYNRGTAAGSTTAADISDFLYTSSSLLNCFYSGAKVVGAKNGTVTDCDRITTPEVLLGLLNIDGNNAWAADTANINGGYPILSWQSAAPVEKVPVTGVSITPVGSPRAGQVLTAVVSGTGGKTPTGLSYRWMLGDSASGDFAALSSETKKTLTLADAHIGKYLYLYVVGDEGSEARSAVLGPILLSETAAVEADKAALPELPACIRASITLTLPVTGANGTSIIWSSSNENVIVESGSVTLPETTDASVTLTATVLCGDARDNKTYTLLVRSSATVSEELADPNIYLSNAVAALQWYNLKPTYGMDTNVCVALKQALENRGYADLTVSLKSADNPVDGAAAISVEADRKGDIQYFYADPSGTRGMWFSSIAVVFTLEKNGLSKDYAVNAVIYWDGEKARQALNEQVLSKIPVPSAVSDSLSLPHYAYTGTSDTPDYGDYTQFLSWATITWTSSDPSIVSIGAAGSYPDTYGPYTTSIKRTTAQQTVTLTAVVTLNKGTDATGAVVPVTVSKSFTVTVDPMSQAEFEAAQAELMAKLNTGLTSPGLTDYVTGESLDRSAVVNDIQFPTTRDYGVDGKYYPVIITSSNEDVIATSGINNAARVYVYRPLPGAEAETVTLTVTITEKASSISAQKSFDITVLPLTQGEINAEIALMAQVKANYFNGIKNANSSADQITGDLHAFQEAYLKDGNPTFVYDYKDRMNHGIVPVAMDGWETLEQWRTFRSSNAAVISHENLLVTRQTESKAVTLTSYLSSETLGKYAEKYPTNADFQKLYYQPVTASLIVRGTNPTSDTPVIEALSVSFTLQSADSTWISKNTISGVAEGSTVFDLFTSVLRDNDYTFSARGSYIDTITTPGGKTLSELDAGGNSGWMYKVNGVIPSSYMAAYPLRNGDNVIVFFTKDFTSETGYSNWGQNESSSQTPGGIAPAVTAQNGSADAAVSAEAVTSAIAENNGRVVIAPQVTGSASSVSMSLPASSVREIAESPSGSLSFETAGGSVNIPNAALAAISRQTGGTELKMTVAARSAEDISLPAEETANAVIVEISIGSGDKKITSFEGASLSVAIPVTGAFDEGASYRVIVISSDGTSEVLTGKVVLSGGKKFVEVGVTHLSTFVVTTDKASAYDDVENAVWYYDAVQYVSLNGIMTGTGEKTFSPDSKLSRAMLVTVLYRMAGSPPVIGTSGFKDASDSASWYYDAVVWASASGIVNGYGDGSFGVNDNISREQMVTVFYRYAKYKDLDVSAGENMNILSYSDSLKISDWAYPALQWALGAGILTGTGPGTLSPFLGAARCEAAAVITRFAEKTKA